MLDVCDRNNVTLVIKCELKAFLGLFGLQSAVNIEVYIAKSKIFARSPNLFCAVCV